MELLKEEEIQVKELLRLNRYMTYQEAKNIITEKLSIQKRLK